MISGENDKSGIQFPDQENTNRLKYCSDRPTTTRAKIKILLVFGSYLKFWGEGLTSKDRIGTLENMGIAFGILSRLGTEPGIHLEGNLTPPHNCNVHF